jgi:hypothetical protein
VNYLRLTALRWITFILISTVNSLVWIALRWNYPVVICLQWFVPGELVVVNCQKYYSWLYCTWLCSVTVLLKENTLSIARNYELVWLLIYPSKRRSSHINSPSPHSGNFRQGNFEKIYRNHTVAANLVNFKRLYIVCRNYQKGTQKTNVNLHPVSTKELLVLLVNEDRFGDCTLPGRQ